MNYREYLKSDSWKFKRKKKYQSSNTKKCAICLSSENLEVHHLSYKPNLEEVENCDLRILCNSCHNTTHKLIKSGQIKFKNDKHSHRFSVIRNAIRKKFGNEYITKHKKRHNEILENYRRIYKKKFKVENPEITQILTWDIIQKGKSVRGAWNLAQLRLFGFDNFPKKGWQEMVVGQEWPRETINQFLALKNAHLK